MLGNFLSRIASPGLYTRLSMPLPSISSISSPDYIPGGSPTQESVAVRDLLAKLNTLSLRVRESLDSLEISAALETIVDLLRDANTTISDVEPWRTQKCSAELAADTLVVSREVLRVVGICLQPFIPIISERLLDALSVGRKERTWEFAEVGKGSGSGNMIKPVNDLVGKTLLEKSKPAKVKAASRKNSSADK